MKATILQTKTLSTVQPSSKAKKKNKNKKQVIGGWERKGLAWLPLISRPARLIESINSASAFHLDLILKTRLPKGRSNFHALVCVFLPFLFSLTWLGQRNVLVAFSHGLPPLTRGRLACGGHRADQSSSANDSAIV